MRWNSLTTLGRRVVIGAAIASLVFAFLSVRSCQTAQTAKTEAKLATGQTGAALESGADAVGAIGRTHQSEVRIDVITQENERAIRQAEGADAPVSDAVHAAGLRALCRRAAYRGSEQCLQQPPAD